MKTWKRLTNEADSYINNLNFRVDDNLNIYTDASKNKDNHNSIGWVVINSQVIELELLAILAALMMVKENRKVNIYTDNMGVVELWSSLFNENRIIWSTRRIWNINFGASLMIVDLKFLFLKLKVIQIIWVTI
uniref:Uncharacterized protein n=1 Tax=Rhizophagus irregularis (strain DAOM 181602 / DAOM 197198 / MUCL 43194) TaxID=747089 RepID=U9UEX5_RHIID